MKQHPLDTSLTLEQTARNYVEKMDNDMLFMLARRIAPLLCVRMYSDHAGWIVMPVDIDVEAVDKLFNSSDKGKVIMRPKDSPPSDGYLSLEVNDNDKVVLGGIEIG